MMKKIRFILYSSRCKREKGKIASKVYIAGVISLVFIFYVGSCKLFLSKKLPSVALTTLYYGQLPKDFDVLTYPSMCANKDFTFLILGEISDPLFHEWATCANVRYVRIPFHSLRQRIFSTMNVDFPHHTCDYSECQRKLTDLKPMFGEMFKEEFSRFDYWSYSDIDLIYGDLAKFLSPYLAERFDVISGVTHEIHGPFTLFRNVDYVNELYKFSNFKEILEQPSQQAFDEGWWSKKRSVIQTTMDELVREQISHHISVPDLLFNTFYIKMEWVSVTWNQGKLTVGIEELWDAKEFGIIHFLGSDKYLFSKDNQRMKMIYSEILAEEEL